MKKPSNQKGIGYCCPTGPEIVAIGFNHGTSQYIVSYNVTVMDSFLAISDCRDKLQVISVAKPSIVRFANAVKLAIADYKTIMRELEEESADEYLDKEGSETLTETSESITSKQKVYKRKVHEKLHELCQQASRKLCHQPSAELHEIILSSTFCVEGVVYSVEIVRLEEWDALRLSKVSHSRQAIVLPMTETDSLEIALNSILGIQFTDRLTSNNRFDVGGYRDSVVARNPEALLPEVEKSSKSTDGHPESETLSEESHFSDESQNSSSSESGDDGLLDLETNEDGLSIGTKDSGDTLDEHKVFVQSVHILDNNSFKISFLHENSRYVVTVPSKTAAQFYFAVVHASHLRRKDSSN